MNDPQQPNGSAPENSPPFPTPTAPPQGAQEAPYGLPPPPYRAPEPPPPAQAPPQGSAPGRRVPYRTILLAAIAILVVGGVVLGYALRPPPPKLARSIGARLDLAAGEVTVSDAGDLKAMSGTPLASGATVSTGKGARALVRTGEGAAIFLRGETKLKLLDRGVDLAAGEIWLDAPKVDGDALAVKSDVYGVSASDAGLSIKKEDGGFSVYVARGLAILTSPGGRIEIGAGEQGTVKGDAKPTVAGVKFWNDWTGGLGDQRASRFVGSGTGRLYGLDPNASAGAAARKLGIAKQVVKAVVRDGIAETEVDQTFSNPGATPIEGYYWFTVPSTATVTGFALETNGQLVEGEVIEKREAAARYEAAMRTANDPALLEWVDGRTYRARIFPVPASSTRRIVLRYVEMLPIVEGKTRYVYPLRSDDPVRFDELALSVDVGGSEDDVDVATSLDARTENNGRLVSMRRSGFVPRSDFQVEIAHKKKRAPVSAWRFQAGTDQADYVMLRYVPEKDFARQPSSNADVVVVVDTSAGGDDGTRQLRVAAAEAALRALSDHDHFALVTLDVNPKVVYPQDGLAPATEGDIAKALEKLSDHSIGGATDLGAMFEPALARLHGKEQGAVIYVGDGTATSGETAGEALLERLRRSLTGSRARFFAIGAGASANHELLTQLSRAGGGQYVRIDEAGQTTGQALRLASAIKTEAITDLGVDIGAGLDQPLYSVTGKLSRGEEMVLLARTHHALPKEITVRGRFGGKPFEDKHELKVDTSSVTASLVPRLWAAEYVRRLMGAATIADDNRGQILQLGVEYGLVTPYTSSLALDSENAYAMQGITRRRSRLRGVRLTAIERPSDEEKLMNGLALPGALPATAMGCSRSSPTSSSDREDDGAQTKSKGAEGSVVAQSAPAVPPGDVPSMAPVATATANSTTTTTTEADQLADNRPMGGAAANGRRAGQAHGYAAAASAAPAPPPVATPTPTPTPKPIVSMAKKVPNAVGPGGDEKESDKQDRKRNENKVAIANYRAVVRALGACSDVAARPLSERLVLWQKRARKVTSGEELAQIHDRAYSACELPDWRDESALLDILQQRVSTEQMAETLLVHLRSQPDAARFVAKNLLRRTVDVRIAAAVSRALYGGVDWERVDHEIAATDKLDRQLLIIKSAMLAAPDDPQGELRYVRVLARAGERQEALSRGRRLRDRGMMTPTLAQQLGDVLVEANENEEALRTYSEIVEFDGESKESRRVLGDIFQRQGWYAQAYRQYKTLSDLDSKNPLAWLRLANSAASAGRVDEALRIEREVAGGEGTPGPHDPRMFARLLSASRLAALLAKPDPAAGATPEAIGRKLKELSLFSGPGTLAILTWDDLDAQIYVGAPDEKKETLAGEAIDAGAVGLYSVLGTTEAWDRVPHAVRNKGNALARPVKFRLHVLAWDGKSFSVKTKNGELRPSTKAETI
jgi:Ca-activated chloride channel homolog